MDPSWLMVALNFDCDTVLVKWGQKWSLGGPAIVDKSRFVVGEILPEINFNEFYLNQSLPVDISYYTSYCNLNYSTLKIGIQQETSEFMVVRLNLESSVDRL
ncbi:MAG: hypothetical protein GY829_04600 [Gammaproteobacteria bacterium]|nr:hypothetical protein [Gammaproteobacteria bacterium]